MRFAGTVHSTELENTITETDNGGVLIHMLEKLLIVELL